MATKKKIIKVESLAFHRAIETIKKVEKRTKSLIINRKPVSRYLVEASDYTTSNSSIPFEVKMAILLTYGTSNPDPNKLADDTDMADFNFTGIQNISLTRRFNIIAKSHNPNSKTISTTSVIGCDKVKDCVDLVTNAAV